MLIQLRQSEIEVALREYVVNQGINLTGRRVDISFTSGRKDNGISADLDINVAEDEQELTRVVSPSGVIQGFGLGYPEEVKSTCPLKDPEEATDETDFPQDTGEPGAVLEAKTATSLFS